ncbi:ABC transporter permease subunit [Pelomonas saccharophila]|nr:ABC transporter permease subunit [Roseateles saccharophilus]MDG0832898.1 ABC transporter permease subunit [Roseateles saccharophilus]
MALWATLGFFYLPMVVLVVYSFNASEQVTVWAGVSMKWYGRLLADTELLSAASLSLRVAALTALSSMVMGAWAGYVLARFGPGKGGGKAGGFRGLGLFQAMVNAPLVIPEVILGIATLLLFVTLGSSIGWPADLGFVTIWLGHTVLCVSFVALMVQSRVRDIDPTLEEAAQDLGARPLTVFLSVTLPQMSQTVISGGLLSFAISADDLILSAFLSGPGSTTLPMLVFSRVRLGLNPEMNALATVFMAVVALAVWGATRFTARQRRRSQAAAG